MSVYLVSHPSQAKNKQQNWVNNNNNNNNNIYQLLLCSVIELSAKCFEILPFDAHNTVNIIPTS